MMLRSLTSRGCFSMPPAEVAEHIRELSASGETADNDLARTLQQLNIGWAWWVWRGGGDPKGGSSGFVWGTGTAAGHDAAGLAAVVPFLA